jgi:hypothetical protein
VKDSLGLFRHSYNGIGELTKKTLGCGIQNIDYQYQMRAGLAFQMADENERPG